MWDLGRLQRPRSPNVHPRRVNQSIGSTLPWAVAVVQSRLRARMAVCCELLLRQRFCRGSACGKVFWICRHCDRGQRYCSPLCRQQAYRQQRRRANRRHQQSTEGRLDHRDRQRDYRRRRIAARVTDQGSHRSSFRCRIRLQATTPTPVQRQSRPRAFSGWLRCIVCGRRGRFIDPYS